MECNSRPNGVLYLFHCLHYRDAKGGASACVWTAVIDYPVEDVGGELPQFLNLVRFPAAANRTSRSPCTLVCIHFS